MKLVSMNKGGALVILLQLIAVAVHGQGKESAPAAIPSLTQSRSVTTAVPFLLIAPDARGGAMGDGGVASAADVNSMHWNPAKYAFAPDDKGLGISFTPWLRRLTSDVNLGYVSAYKKLDQQQTLAASFRYFSYGNINYTLDDGTPYGSIKPADFAVDLAYIRKLNQDFSIALAGRYIHSDIGQASTQSGNLQAASAGAVDVAVYYSKDSHIGRIPATISYGVNISNIGTKLNYGTAQNQFLPTNLKVGAGSDFHFDDNNSLAINLDINKLLVPTPPIRDQNNNVIKGKDPNVSVPSGIFQSFYDAPGGVHEEIQELSYAVGAEYNYNKHFFLRSGYFYEDPMKGNRQYFTAGAGVRYRSLHIDTSYLIAEKQSPLNNTLRFSLSFSFGDKLSKGDSAN